MESHEHPMDADYVRETVEALAYRGLGDPEDYGDPWGNVLSVEHFRMVRIMLGVGGPTRYLDILVDGEGDVRSASYVDTWAVPDTFDLDYSEEIAACQEIVDAIGGLR